MRSCIRRIFVRPDKFGESETRTLVRYKMEQYGAIPGDDYTIIERMLTVCAFGSAHLKGFFGSGVYGGQDQHGNDVTIAQSPTEAFCNWSDL